MKIASFTLGCKLNNFESEALISKFRDQGFFIQDWQESSDIFIINTCTVTSKSEQKARRVIRKVARENPNSAVVVTGCYAHLDPQEIAELGSNIHVVSQENKASIAFLADYIVSHGYAKENINQIVRDFFLGENKADIFSFDSNDLKNSSRAYLKIQDGCDNFCNYCRIPLARGKSQSLDNNIVLERMDNIIEKGYREIILTGINISAYQYMDVDFADLLQSMVKKYQGSKLQIRISSIEPDAFSEKLYNVLSNDIFCPHFHIAVQAASSKVLKQMGRNYNADILPEIVKRLREIKKDPFLAADIIAGYAGESDKDFEETYEFLKNSDFAYLHVFPFSPREGTVDEHPKNPVPERVRDERAAALRSLSAKSHQAYLLRSDGREVNYIAEKRLADSGDWLVVTDNYIKAWSKEELVRGEMYRGVFAYIKSGQNIVK